MKKYERPINPLASWTDISSSDDDESEHSSFAFVDDVEYTYRCHDENENDWKMKPKHDLSSWHRLERLWQEMRSQKDRQSQTKAFKCWNWKANSRKWRILCSLATILLGLIGIAIPLGLHRAKSSSNTSSRTLPPVVEPTLLPTNMPQQEEESLNDVTENEQDESESVSWSAPPDTQKVTVVLRPNEYLLGGQFRSSPNGKYRLELTEDGNLVLTYHGSNNRSTIWSTQTTGNDVRVYLQPDGNMLLRNAQRKTLWSTETHGYPGARLVLTDHGQLSIQTESWSTSTVSTAIWMDGVPRSIYRGPAPTNSDLVFPVRGAFYYP
jgi:hypothetical protein